MARLTHKMFAVVTLPARFAEKLGEDATSELLHASVIAWSDCPEGVSAGWSTVTPGNGFFKDNLYMLPMEANVVMNGAHELRAAIDATSQLVATVTEGGEFEAIDDNELDSILSEIALQDVRIEALPKRSDIVVLADNIRDYAVKVAGDGPSGPNYDPDTLCMLSDAANILDRLDEWNGLSNEEMRLRCGEMTLQEIRSVRAVLNAISNRDP